jgi:hypothetical protein
MHSLSKAAFHRTLCRHPKYTQAYLDHAYDIVHDFRKCDIRVLHDIEPKEGGPVQDDEDKKDGKPDPTEKSVEIGSPEPKEGGPVQDDEDKKDGKPDATEKPVEIGSLDSIKTDSPSNEMVTGFPPTPDEFAYVEDDCM